MKASLSRSVAILLIIMTMTAVTGCNQEEVINNSSKIIAEIITNSLEDKETESISHEQIIGEDDPEAIEQHISTTPNSNECWRNGVYEYYFNQLTAEQQAIYNQLYETVASMQNRAIISIDGLAQDELSVIFRSIRYDHPEIYWIQGYNFIQTSEIIELYPKYLVAAEKKSLYDDQLAGWTEKALSNIDLEDMTDYEKEIAIYDYIVKNTNYDLDSDMNQSLISVVQGESVCLGYTKSMKYLCDRIGLECIIIEGTSKEGINHSWNKIIINKNWYNVDSTNSNTAQIFSDNYDMFNITDKLIKNRYTERQISCDCGRINFVYPVADNIKEDYYNRKGLYIDRLEEIESLINNHINEGTITIRLGEQIEIEKIQEYMKDLKIKTNDNNQKEKKCTSFVIMEYIRLLQINWK